MPLMRGLPPLKASRFSTVRAIVMMLRHRLSSAWSLGGLRLSSGTICSLLVYGQQAVFDGLCSGGDFQQREVHCLAEVIIAECGQRARWLFLQALDSALEIAGKLGRYRGVGQPCGF